MADHPAGEDSNGAAPVPDPVSMSLRDAIDGLRHRARVWFDWVGPARVGGAVGTVLVVVAVGWWLLRTPTMPTEAALPVAEPATSLAVTAPPTSSSPAAPATAASPTPVLVHVTGAVAEPGVYELTVGERVDDALAAAGGPTADADANALNLAAEVADGDRIEVPRVGDADAGGAATAVAGGHTRAPGAAAGGSGPIDLNVADEMQLDELPGVGPATAAAIIEYRATNGPFAVVDDLLEVPGIGPAKLARLAGLVTV